MSDEPTQLWGKIVRRRGKPDLVLHLAVIDGRPECVGVEIGARVVPPRQPTDRLWRIRPGARLDGPLRPISASQLRGLDLDDVIVKARREWVRTIKDTASGDLPLGRPIPKTWRAEARARLALADAAEPRRGRPPLYDRQHFSEVARVYREGDVLHKGPTKYVARAFRVSRSTSAKWVARCREMGLLPPTEREQRKTSTRSRGDAARRRKR